jgi:hypothetical protein
MPLKNPQLDAKNGTETRQLAIEFIKKIQKTGLLSQHGQYNPKTYLLILTGKPEIAKNFFEHDEELQLNIQTEITEIIKEQDNQLRAEKTQTTNPTNPTFPLINFLKGKTLSQTQTDILNLNSYLNGIPKLHNEHTEETPQTAFSAVWTSLLGPYLLPITEKLEFLQKHPKFPMELKHPKKRIIYKLCVFGNSQIQPGDAVYLNFKQVLDLQKENSKLIIIQKEINNEDLESNYEMLNQIPQRFIFNKKQWDLRNPPPCPRLHHWWSQHIATKTRYLPQKQYAF